MNEPTPTIHVESHVVTVFCAWHGQTAIGVALVGATIVGIVNALANPRRK